MIQQYENEMLVIIWREILRCKADLPEGYSNRLLVDKVLEKPYKKREEYKL